MMRQWHEAAVEPEAGLPAGGVAADPIAGGAEETTRPMDVPDRCSQT